MECVKACSSGALTQYGQDYTVNEVLEIVLRDHPFYSKSGGGVTFSGGEPLLQPVFLHEMLKTCKANNLHTAVDTAGNVPFEIFLSILPYTDLFLYDVKAIHTGLHRRCTGAGNTRILNNLKRLNEVKAHVWVRLPFIPGVNHGQNEIGALVDTLKDLPAVEKVELLPYHLYGEAKYEQLGLSRSAVELRAPAVSELHEIIDAYRARGLHIECPGL